MNNTLPILGQHQQSHHQKEGLVKSPSLRPALDQIQHLSLEMQSFTVTDPLILPGDVRLTISGPFIQRKGASLTGNNVTIMTGRAKLHGSLKMTSLHLRTAHQLEMYGCRLTVEKEFDLRGKQLLLEEARGSVGDFKTVAERSSAFNQVEINAQGRQKHRFGNGTWTNSRLASGGNFQLDGSDGQLDRVNLSSREGSIGINVADFHAENLRLNAGAHARLNTSHLFLHQPYIESARSLMINGSDLAMIEARLESGSSITIDGVQVHAPELTAVALKLIKIAASAGLIDLTDAYIETGILRVSAHEQILINRLTVQLKTGSIHSSEGWIDALGFSPTVDEDLFVEADKGGIYVFDAKANIGNRLRIVGQGVDLRNGHLAGRAENHVEAKDAIHSQNMVREGELITSKSHGVAYDRESKSRGGTIHREAQIIAARKTHDTADKVEWKAGTIDAPQVTLDGEIGVDVRATCDLDLSGAKATSRNGKVSLDAPLQKTRRLRVRAKEAKQKGSTLHTDHMVVVADILRQKASDLLCAQRSKIRIKGDAKRTGTFIDLDNSISKVGGTDRLLSQNGTVSLENAHREIAHGELRAAVIMQNGMKERLRGGMSTTQTKVLVTNAGTEQSGSGRSQVKVESDHTDYSTTHLRGVRTVTAKGLRQRGVTEVTEVRYEASDGFLDLAGRVDARRGFFSAQASADVTISGQVHLDDEGIFSGRYFHNLGRVRSEGDLQIQQERYIPIFDATAAGNLHLKIREAFTPSHAFDVEGALTLQSLQGRINILYPVNTAGKGSWISPVGIDFNAPVILEQGIDVETPEFNVSDRLQASGHNRIDVDWLNLQKSDVTFQGINDFTSRKGAVNLGSEFLISGETFWTGAALQNKSEMHLERRVTRAPSFFGTGLRTWDSDWVIDRLANTQINGILHVDWTVGTHTNTGVFHVKKLDGYIGHIDLGIRSLFGRMPKLPEHTTLMPELVSQTVGDIQTLEGTDLRVDTYNQVGGNFSSRGPNKMKAQVWNSVSRARHIEEEYSCQDFWSSWTRSRQVIVFDSSSVFDGDITVLEPENGSLTGRLHGKRKLVINAGNWRQSAMKTERLHHFDMGGGGFAVQEGASARTVFTPATATSSEGIVLFDVEDKWSSEGSITGGKGNTTIRAGEIEEKALFSSYTASNRQGLFSEETIRDVDVMQGGAYSEDGRLNMESQKTDFVWEGFLAGNNGSLKSARDMHLVSNSMTVENQRSGFEFSPTSISWEDSAWTTTRATLPLFNFRSDLDLHAAGLLHTRGVQANTGGKLNTRFSKRFSEAHQHTDTYERSGFSLSVSFLGSNAINTACNGGGNEDVWMSLANEMPAVRAFTDLTRAEGIGIPIQMASSFTKLHNFIRSPAEWLAPSISFRLGTFHEERESTTSIVEHYNVGDDVVEDGPEQRYVGTQYKSEGRVTHRGYSVVFEDHEDTSSYERLDFGVNATISASGVTPGADMSMHLASSTHYSPWKIDAEGGHEVDASHVSMTHRQDTHEEMGVSLSGNTDGDMTVGMQGLGVGFNADIGAMRKTWKEVKDSRQPKKSKKKVDDTRVDSAGIPLPLANSAPTLMDQLKTLASEDFLDVNLGLSREEMPQLSREAKEELVQKFQEHVKGGIVKAKELRASQSEVSDPVVFGMAQFAKTIGPWSPCTAEIVTANGPNGEIMVVDGHHRAAACFQLEGHMPILHIDRPIQEVLSTANTLSGVTHATLSGRQREVYAGNNYERPPLATSHEEQKIKMLQMLSSNVGIDPTGVSALHRARMTASLLEGLTREEQIELLRSARLTQRQASERTLRMIPMAPFYAVSLATDGLAASIHYSRKSYCQIPGNQWKCAIQDAAMSLGSKLGRAMINGASTAVSNTVRFSCNLHPLNRRQCDAVQSLWTWAGKQLAWNEESAIRLEREYGIPQDFTLRAGRGFQEVAELAAAHFAIGWALKLRRTSTLADWQDPFSGNMFRDTRQVKRLSGPRERVIEGEYKLIEKSSGPSNGGSKRSVTKKQKPVHAPSKPVHHEVSGTMSEQSIRLALFENGERFKYSRPLKSEDVGRVRGNPKGRLVVSDKAVRAEVKFLGKNTAKYMAIYGGLIKRAVQEKTLFLETTVFFKKESLADSVRQQISSCFGGSIIDRTLHTLSNGETLEKVTFKSPVKAPTPSENSIAAQTTETPEYVRKISRIAIQLGDMSISSQANTELKLTAISKILTNYAAIHEIDGVAQFVISQLKVPKGKFSVKTGDEVLDPLERGRSKNSRLYQISAFQGRKIIWIKIFNKKEIAIRELVSLDTFQRLGIPKTRFPTIEGIGNISSLREPMNIDEWFIAMSHVPGVSGEILMSQAGKLELGSYRRAKTLEKVADFTEQVALVLGMMHTNTMQRGARPTKRYLKDTVKKLRIQVGDVERRFPFRINMEYLENNIIKPFKDNPGDASLVHGDANLRNFRTDSKGISLFDVQSLARSRNKMTGNPTGTPARDSEQFLMQLEICGRISKLTSTEIGQVKKIFHERYLNTFDGHLTREAQTFYKVFNLLDIISFYYPKNSDLVLKILEDYRSVFGSLIERVSSNY